MFTRQKRLGSEWTYALFGIVIGICAPIGQLQHGGNRRLEIGHQTGIEDARFAGRVGRGKRLEGRLDFHAGA